MLNPVQKNSTESIVGIILLALVTSLLFSGFVHTSPEACTYNLSLHQEYRRRKRLKLRHHIIGRIMQEEAFRICHRYLRNFALVAIALFFFYRWQSSGSFDVSFITGFGGLQAASTEDKFERVEVQEDDSSIHLVFRVPVTITIDKNNKDMAKLLHVVLGWITVPPTPSCNNHTMSLREVQRCTGAAPSTIRQHQNRFLNGGLPELVHKGMGVRLPWELRKQISVWISEDPTVSPAQLATKANEEQICNKTSWTVEDAAACLRQVDLNVLQPILVKLLAGKTSILLVDKLLEINRELVLLVKKVPMQVKMQIDEITALRKQPGVFTPSSITLEEKRQSSDAVKNRRRLKLYLLRIYLGIRVNIECPDCGSTRIGTKEIRTSSVQTREGSYRTQESIRYYCKNAACSTHTFTIPDSWRELGAQRAKDVKELALNRLFHMRSSLRHGADTFFGNLHIDHSTLLRWIQREAQELVPWYTLFTPIACETIAVDEKWVKIYKA